MKAIISINGQISGNSRLARAISTPDSKLISTSFNGYQIIFERKRDAYKALWLGYLWLRSQEPEFKGGISYAKGWLSYDASQARLDN